MVCVRSVCLGETENVLVGAFGVITGRRYPQRERLTREIGILQSLKYKHTLKFVEHFEETLDGKSWGHIVTEYCSGGTLFTVSEDGDVDN